MGKCVLKIKYMRRKGNGPDWVYIWAIKTPILLMTKKLHYLPFNTVRSGMDKAR